MKQFKIELLYDGNVWSAETEKLTPENVEILLNFIEKASSDKMEYFLLKSEGKSTYFTKEILKQSIITLTEL